MSINNFITNILNIDNQRIESINTIEQSDKSVNILIRLKRSLSVCPYCKIKLNIHDYRRKKIRHSTLVNRPCVIFYSQRRCICPCCDMIFSEDNPFSSRFSSTSYETTINVLTDLKKSNETYSSVAERFNLSVTAVTKIFDKHVNIPRKTLPVVLSMDEHYFPQSTYDSLYMCILMDFHDGTIIDVLPDRKKNYLISYFSNIKNTTLDETTMKSELDNVRFVSIDLYDNYRDIANTYMPSALVCADSFHVLEHLTDDFNQVRLRCRRNCQDDNISYLLTKFKYIFRHNTNLDNEGNFNRRFGKYMNYRQIINLLFDRFPDLEKAYNLKESYINFNSDTSLKDADALLNKQILAFADSGLDEYIEFYNLLVNWRGEIINSFNLYKGKRINNSFMESRNKQIETLLYNANGFKNYKRTRNRILYCLNKNDTYKL